jgi:hypothetical protein
VAAMSTQEQSPDHLPERFVRVIGRLADETEADKVRWERGAPFDSYAVDVATVRFRVRSAEGNGRAPYLLEFLRDGSFVMPRITDPDVDPVEAELIERLYTAARESAIRHSPDPFDAVERELGTIIPSSATE